MTRIPIVRLNHVLPAIEVVGGMDASMEKMLWKAKLPAHAVGDPEAYAARHLVHAFAARVARVYGIDDLGHRAAYSIPFGRLPGFSAGFEPTRGATTLYEALSISFTALKKESSGLRVWMEDDGDGVWLVTNRPSAKGLDEPEFAQVEPYVGSSIVRMVQEACGPSWRPAWARLKTRSEQGIAKDFFSETALSTNGPVTAIALPRDTLQMTLPSHGRPASPALKDEQGRNVSSEFSQALQVALRPYLGQGSPRVELAATIAGTSVRTLQRRLAATGMSYTQLLDRVRYEALIELLEEDDLALADVASELGYTDQAHLTRAVRRWTGMTPRALRKRIRDRADPERAVA